MVCSYSKLVEPVQTKGGSTFCDFVQASFLKGPLEQIQQCRATASIRKQVASVV